MSRKVKQAAETEKEAFPTILRTLMAERKLKQGDLAKGIDMTRQAISLYSTGQSTPDIKTLSKMADFFDVSCDYLLGRTDTKTPDVTVREMYDKTGLLEEAIISLQALNEYKDKTTLAMLRFINSLITESGSAWEQLALNADAYEYTKNHVGRATFEVREVYPNGEEKISAYDARQLRIFTCREWIAHFIDSLKWNRDSDSDTP